MEKGTSRRGISEVIVSLLLLAITVAGGIVAFTIVTSDTGTLQAGTIDTTTKSTVKIIGFDTRDGIDLLGLTDVDNTFDSGLTIGTEHIVLKIRNTGTSIIFINSIIVNEVAHNFDTDSAGQATSAALPSAGEFSILPALSTTQQDTAVVNENRDVRIIATLSASIDTGDLDNPTKILLDKGMRIQVDTGSFDNRVIVIPSGATR